VKLRVLYFARLREELGRSAEAVEFPGEAATVAALRDFLSGRDANWAAALAPRRGVRIAVNQDMAEDATALAAGDEVAFFPPVTGG